MESLVKDILSKKELRNLNEKFIKEQLENYFEKNKEIKKKLELKEFNKRSEEYKRALKEVRKKLREIYGVFIEKNYSKKEKLLSEISKDNQEEIISKILNLHKSTKERLPFYDEIYEKILRITGKQKTILDLACGLNPISYLWLGYKPNYIASDISSKDLEFIQKFFAKTRIHGKTIQIDLVSEHNKVKNIKTEICFFFKTLDSLEVRKKNISKNLIENINANWLVFSFSKISLGGGKKIAKSKRKWLINFIKKQGFFYKEFEVPNEYFVVVKRF